MIKDTNPVAPSNAGSPRVAENERHAQQIERILRCLNIPIPADVAALKAAVIALRSLASSPAQEKTPHDPDPEAR